MDGSRTGDSVEAELGLGEPRALGPLDVFWALRWTFPISCLLFLLLYLLYLFILTELLPIRKGVSLKKQAGYSAADRRFL